MARLLVIDDEKGIREALVQVFEYEGHEVRAAEDGPDDDQPGVPGLHGRGRLTRFPLGSPEVCKWEASVRPLG